MSAERDRQILQVLEKNERLSYREIGANVGITSANVVSNALRRLAAQGYIRLGPKHSKRSLAVLRPSSAFSVQQRARKRTAADLLAEADGLIMNLDYDKGSALDEWHRDYQRWKK